MHVPAISRRGLFATAMGGVLGASVASAQDSPPAARPTFRYCLNTSTVRRLEGQWGKSRPIVDLIEITRKAGYSAIEPWISELVEYTRTGGTLKDLKKRIDDAGLAVPDAIGFSEWIVVDEARRKKGLEQAKRDMDMVQQIGGVRLAAPPVGATAGGSARDKPETSPQVTDLLAAADRYRALLEIGQTMGITPIVEIWGHSKTLNRLGEAILIATECGKTGGGILPDIYHLYKGGSLFTGLPLLGPNTVGIFHVNDYPQMDRATIKDQDRVFPGDGVAPMKEILSTLARIGYTGYLSLELFNHTYWQQDPLTVAKTGLDKLKAQVDSI